MWTRTTLAAILKDIYSYCFLTFPTAQSSTCALMVKRWSSTAPLDLSSTSNFRYLYHLVIMLIDTVASVRPISPILGRYNGIINCNRADAAARQVPYKYWRCVAGIPQVVFCSDGLFFNEFTQQCDFEANSKCIQEQEDELKQEFIKYE
ncbi:unnamed protein product [Spodoptera littoralis]|uniref:Chitin-binding type-2 domain-containing protein n=1 Tax=Spodoptera littoralis TaxID=7109 RepID=A0A9P0IBX1_SPOLI|nr:unnamed protein product [Spodoptera littoralis]CAH1643036.1 unnamed protein product [Spodoptera littoralis]